MDVRDVGMIQRCKHAGFTLETRYTLRILRECFGEKFDRDTAAQFRVGRLIDLAHTACSQVTGNLVMRELGSDHDGDCGPHLTQKGEKQKKKGGNPAESTLTSPVMP
jgi:hypothetical protein